MHLFVKKVNVSSGCDCDVFGLFTRVESANNAPPVRAIHPQSWYLCLPQRFFSTMDSARGAAPATCSGSSSPSSSPGSASRSSSMRSARSSESGDSYSDDNEFRRPDSPSPSLGFGQRAAPQNAAPPLPSAGMGATASTLRPAAPRRISFGERSMYDALDALPGLPATTAAGVQSSSGGASASASHQGQLHPPWNYRAVRARIPSLEEIKKQAPSVAQPAPPTHAQDFLKAVRYLAAVLVSLTTV